MRQQQVNIKLKLSIHYAIDAIDAVTTLLGPDGNKRALKRPVVAFYPRILPTGFCNSTSIVQCNVALDLTCYITVMIGISYKFADHIE